MNFRFGMIADDLTGANDSGIQLKEKGLATSVYFEIPEQHHELDEAIVIDTDSRAIDKENACEKTKAAAEFLAEKGYQQIYKKMDSTLRGYIGYELQAISEVFNPVFTIVAPAFPAYGRTTRDGIHYMKGKPVSETELAHDPKHPVTESHIPSILEKETGQKTAVIDETLLNAKDDEWSTTINRYIDEGIEYLVCDASTEEDLKKLAARIHGSGHKVVWSGSAGLAEVLPAVIGIESSAQLDDGKQKNGPVLGVCGSLSQTTQEQVNYAIRQKDIQPVEIDTERIFYNDWEDQAEGYKKEALEHLSQGKDVIFYVPSHEDIRRRVQKRAAELELDSFQIGKKISEALSLMTETVVGQTSVSALVLTGGDTAKDVAKALGATGIRLSHQLEAGIPVGELIGDSPSLPVVTKAGAFGKESSIYHAMKKMKGAVTNEQ
ncbi:four-carbon acid sugar kinase family protein [Halobacillus litoralis]|uniref:four-carbon acid sugar kinase family protein n=1 Tax=Halobacillus litoralis TaxID=45668 RepID=UPI0024938BDC|nr:four-carbon acid sugar kinase family protein [Halobacillus litoralis]